MASDGESSEFLLGGNKYEDEITSDNRLIHQGYNRLRKVLVLVIFISIQVFVLQVFVAWTTFSPQTTQLRQSTERMHGKYCGNSSVEARASGCYFDIFSYGWHPPECWDEELYEDFLERHNSSVRRWETPQGTAVDFEEVKQGEHAFLITTWEFHLIHCLYAWEKTTRSVLMDKPQEEWSPRYPHARHCVHELLHQDRYGMQEMMTSTTMWYPICGLSEPNKATLLGHKPFEE